MNDMCFLYVKCVHSIALTIHSFGIECICVVAVCQCVSLCVRVCSNSTMPSSNDTIMLVRLATGRSDDYIFYIFVAVCMNRILSLYK